MNKDITEQFQNEIAKHQMIVEADDDAGNRRLFFGRPGTMIMHFRIITFADYLVYTGDMGSFIFRRQKDMFTFFRGESWSPRYWSEKLEATDRCDGFLDFEHDHAMAGIRSHIEHLPETDRLTIESHFDDYYLTELEFLEAARTCTLLPQDYWDDFSQWMIKVYSHRFKWCCHAIGWAISTYDKTQKGADLCISA